MHPEIMLFLGMFACYMRVCQSFRAKNLDKSFSYVLLNFWRVRFFKTVLNVIGGYVGYNSIPLLVLIYPASFTLDQAGALTGLLAFVSGYAGSVTIDKVVTFLHKKTGRIF